MLPDVPDRIVDANVPNSDSIAGGGVTEVGCLNVRVFVNNAVALAVLGVVDVVGVVGVEVGVIGGIGGVPRESDGDAVKGIGVTPVDADPTATTANPFAVTDEMT